MVCKGSARPVVATIFDHFCCVRPYKTIGLLRLRLSSSLSTAQNRPVASGGPHTGLQEGRCTNVRSAVGAVWRLATKGAQTLVEARLAMAHASGLLHGELTRPQG